MRITADTDVCIGAGQCVLTDDTLFDQDDEGTVVLLAEHVERAALENARTAVDLCPSRALSLVDE